MNVFIPALKDKNPFFDEVMLHSKHTYIFDIYKNYKPTYKVVLIHWPEQIFDWKEPSNDELIELESAIDIWKQKSKILYVIHNIERHFGMTENFRKLYQIIVDNCNTMIHMGNYSSNLFKDKYPSKKHQIINHPLYQNSFTIFSKDEARKKLNISKDAVVIIAPGAIRNKEESKLVLNAFRGLKTKNKVLIVPRMLPFEFPFEFKGRTFLKRIIDIKKYYLSFKDWQYKKPTYYFNYNFLEQDDLALLMSASDIVFIPRIKILNSGNVFLAMTYKKVMLGPNQGNLTEIFKLFKLPYFNPKEKSSISKAMSDAFLLFNENKFKYDAILLNKYSPAVLANEWDTLINAQT